MGIRFFCEHCHKQLNVKTHQAGMEGVCPKCDEAIRVPEKSTILSKAELHRKKKKKAERRRKQEALEAAAAQQKSSSISEFAEYDQASNKDSVNIQSVEQFQAERARRKALRDSRSSFTPPADRQSTEGSFLLDKPVNPWLAPNGPDPISTGIKLVWYVRSPEGGEHGPIKGKNIQQMLDEGEIAGNCFVWRQDWQDWHRAATVFKQLATPEDYAEQLGDLADAAETQGPPLITKQKVLIALVAIIVCLATIGGTAWLLNTLW